MWSSSASAAATARHIGLPPEFFFMAPNHNPDASAAASTTTTINFDPHSLGVGVIPLLTTAGDARAGSSMQLWQQHQQQQGHNNNNNNNNYLKSGGNAAAIINGASSSIGTTTCQDCGNQAKKDCSHGRCRSCCKSRGFDCSTHVKSTWVPAARRRERQLMGSNTAAGSSQSTSSAKKPRFADPSKTSSHTSTSNNNTPTSFETTSNHQDAGFKESLPGQVNAPAVFKCVRVTAVDDGEDEYAYQAVVRIGGHVFKGFLYDQGFEGNKEFPNMSDLHLGGGGGGRNGASSSNQVNVDPTHDLYAGGLIGGPTYGNPIN
ncbi:hypothetical protein CASFOL_034162 [Castilleja foliolosa]|uniref:Uncharacterized protein n=1 Tax=Castilleja foliolosa TaxID=1961234 RepID=A0ABD3BWT3_9LAMI